MNMSPFGPLLQLSLGNVGLPKLGPCAVRGVRDAVAAAAVEGVAPDVAQVEPVPTSWVGVRPRLNGAAAVPSVPKAVFRMTTPSVALGPPGNCA